MVLGKRARPDDVPDASSGSRPAVPLRGRRKFCARPGHVARGLVWPGDIISLLGGGYAPTPQRRPAVG